jgi:hypothetical protein
VLRRAYPQDPVLIDLGIAELGTKYTPEDGDENLAGPKEIHHTRRMLARAGLHVQSPPHPADLLDINPEAILGFQYVNSVIKGMSPAWRARFVDRAEGPYHVLRRRLKWEIVEVGW